MTPDDILTSLAVDIITSAEQGPEGAPYASAAAQTATEAARDAAQAAAVAAAIDAQATAADRVQTGLDAATATAQANAAAASYDAFDDRFLGAKAVAPSLDNDGNALQVGALYWDTALTSMRVWSGSAWLDPLANMVTETDARVLYDEELTRAVAYATDIAGQATRFLRGALTAIAGLSVADNNFIVGNGSTFVAESGATARTSLGLGDSATKNVGTTTGTVAAGDDSRITGAATAANLTTETDNRVLYDEELTRAVAYATDLAGQVACTLSGAVPSAAPASAAAPGTPGQIRYDSGYLYLCVAANTWKRVALSTWS